jgi:protein-S-isoprenylcysteine O-methyltransferase Ste14
MYFGGDDTEPTKDKVDKKDKKFAIVLTIVLSIFILIPLMIFLLSAGIAMIPSFLFPIGLILIIVAVAGGIYAHKAVYNGLLKAFN